MLVHQRKYVAISIISALSAISVGCKGTGSSGATRIDAYPAYSLDNSYTDRTGAEAKAGAAPGAADAAGAHPSLSRLPDEANHTTQQYCPVTGAKLGSMGPPVPVLVGGQTVYVCCAGCVEKIERNPERYHVANQVPWPRDKADDLFQGKRLTHGSATSPADSSGACSGSSCCH